MDDQRADTVDDDAWQTAPDFDSHGELWVVRIVGRRAFAGEKLVAVSDRAGRQPPQFFEFVGAGVDFRAPQIEGRATTHGGVLVEAPVLEVVGGQAACGRQFAGESSMNDAFVIEAHDCADGLALSIEHEEDVGGRTECRAQS